MIYADEYGTHKNQKESYENLDMSFEGTLINIEFNIDGKTYFLKDEDKK